jgi:hypothetical protein
MNKTKSRRFPVTVTHLPVTAARSAAAPSPRADADTALAKLVGAIAGPIWLESVGYPSVRALAVDQPIIIDGHAVTFWEPVSSDGDEYATIAEVADVIRQLHRLPVPDPKRGRARRYPRTQPDPPRRCPATFR